MTFRGDGKKTVGHKNMNVSAPRKMIMKQLPIKTDRSSSMLGGDLSNLRDAETPLDSTFCNSKAFQMSKGDTLRQ